MYTTGTATHVSVHLCVRLLSLVSHKQVMGANIIREVKIGAQLGRGHLNIVKPKDLILTRCGV